MLKIVFYLVSYYKRLKTNAQNCNRDVIGMYIFAVWFIVENLGLSQFDIGM